MISTHTYANTHTHTHTPTASFLVFITLRSTHSPRRAVCVRVHTHIHHVHIRTQTYNFGVSRNGMWLFWADWLIIHSHTEKAYDSPTQSIFDRRIWNRSSESAKSKHMIDKLIARWARQDRLCGRYNRPALEPHSLRLCLGRTKRCGEQIQEVERRWRAGAARQSGVLNQHALRWMFGFSIWKLRVHIYVASRNILCQNQASTIYYFSKKWAD